MTVDKIQLVTHNGTFHADEVSAVALLHVYGIIDYPSLNIIRTREMDVINQADIVLDVGGIHDPDKRRFDHHQIVNGRVSSAGLVWQWIKQQGGEVNRQIDRFVDAVDKHDCGVQKMPGFSFAEIIASYNHGDVFNESRQQRQFYEALKIAVTFIADLKVKQERLIKTQEIIKRSQIYHIGKCRILILDEYAYDWTALIHGQSRYSKITHVVWFVKAKNEWCIQIPTVKAGSFDLVYRKLLPDDKAAFVHQNGFLAVYKSKEALVNMFGRLSRPAASD
ncbi:MYG1 family protein [Psychromonas ossibalaenae]|uniref:MYG1 family protein n=1 Tax=Psychromonas ossibalaenae TaxID=444922 RepID=UPI0003701957|nr:MYG1 family protein [Psychromonas ossibalaenae]